MRAAIAIAFLSALPASIAAQSLPPDAVAIDGDIHRLILDNEHLRVFDARAERGMRSPMHSHPPMVLVSLGKARFRLATPDGKSSVIDLNPGQVLWRGEPSAHAWELLSGELHAIGVEIKAAQGAGAAPGPVARPASDAVAMDPEAHHLLFENAYVRVFEGRTSHGRASPMHTHPASLLVSQDWMRLKFTLPDGSSAVHDFHPGQVLWAPDGGTHSWQALAGSGRVIAIEVKSARPAPAAN